MKIFEYLYKRSGNKKFKNIPIEKLISKINNDIANEGRIKINITIMGDNIKFEQELFNNILIKFIHQRCDDINLFSNSSIIKQKYDNDSSIPGLNKIKLFGDYNLIYNNSTWVEIEGEKINNLHLKNDLYFSESDIYFIIKEYINFFEFKNIDHDIIFTIIQKSKIDNTDDLKKLVRKLFFSELSLH
jgi:hypothetical protein